MEVFFRALEPEEIADIAFHSAERAGFSMTREAARMVGRFAACGRDAVNIVQKMCIRDRSRCKTGFCCTSDWHGLLRTSGRRSAETGGISCTVLYCS